MPKTERIFNQCVNEFKAKNRSIIMNEDIALIKASKAKILSELNHLSSFLNKQPEIYKNAIKKKFSEIVVRNVSREAKKYIKEYQVEKLFSEYVETFWDRQEMQSPLPFDNNPDWGGTGLVISNDRSYTGRSRDIAIHTDDYRFVLFTREVYALCREVTNFRNKYIFFGEIGEILKKFQNRNTKLVLNQEIFEELCQFINLFICQELRYLKNYQEELEYYSVVDNF